MKTGKYTAESSVQYKRYRRFIFVGNIIGKSSKFTRANFLGSYGLFYFIRICKFGSFKNLLACLNFILDSEDLFGWYKQNRNFRDYELQQQPKQVKTMV